MATAASASSSPELAAYAGGKVTDLQSGGTAMNSRMLNQRWDLSTSDRQPIRDMLTGQPVPAATDDRQMPQRRACWVHDGSLYALWDDMTIGRFTFATAKGGPSTAAAVAGPSLRIEPTAAVETGVVLDGRTKAEISVLLRDANSRPMPGVTVEIEIDDKELGGDRGALEVRNEFTDREGRVRATYLPPAVDTSRLTTLRFMPIGLAASVQLQGQKRLEATATLRGLPTSIAQLQGSHVGFEPSAAILFPTDLTRTSSSRAASSPNRSPKASTAVSPTRSAGNTRPQARRSRSLARMENRPAAARATTRARSR